MSLARWRVVWADFELELRLRRLRRELDAAQAEVGKAFRARAVASAVLDEPLAGALARVVVLEERERELAQRLADSLAADRRDYRAVASGIARGLIVVRGILDRLVVRDEAFGARRELPRRRTELGACVQADERAAARLPDEVRRAADEARAAFERVRSERALLLAPFDGQALPRPLAALLREFATFAAFLRVELTKKIVLRLPALAAMAAGWWLARHYTSSRLPHWLTGDGRGRLSEDTLALLAFWLPLLAAALAAYASYSLSRRVRRRYLESDPRDSAPAR